MESIVANLGPYRIRQTTVQYYHGEDAARIAGEPDGMEDERWRAVFVMAYDQDQMPVIPPAPPRMIEVRTVSKLNVGVSTGGAADESAKYGKFTDTMKNQLGWDVQEMSGGETVMMSSTARLSRIETNEDKQNYGFPGVADVNISIFTIKYFYGDGPQARVNKNGKFISSEEGYKWLNDPKQAYIDERKRLSR
jgi:hypothetical protein